MLKNQILFQGKVLEIDGETYVESLLSKIAYQVDSIINQLPEGKVFYGEWGNPIRSVHEDNEAFLSRASEVLKPVVKIENVHYKEGSIFGDVTFLEDKFPAKFDFSMRWFTTSQIKEGRAVQCMKNLIAIDLRNAAEGAMYDFFPSLNNMVNYDAIFNELMKSLDISSKMFNNIYAGDELGRKPIAGLLECRTVVLKTGRQSGFSQWAKNKAMRDPRTYLIVGGPEGEFIKDGEVPNITGSFFRGDITQYDLIIIDSDLKHDLAMMLRTALTSVRAEDLEKSNVRFLIGY